ncbi:dihydrofolate reductase protein [Rutstroemia sp. NJR-2017a BBW]|nr:dihydrofolate reductase protein [Rutstroemia sp. NJR-2017a BBW]
MTTSDSSTTMLPRELTLIVAATNKMGIGKAGTLPWTGLKKEMAYFARVTKRADAGKTNTVIMGRKTWESIPPRFRPLKDRTNIIITRSASLADTPLPPNSHITNSISDALALTAQLEESSGRNFIIGGAQIYKEALGRSETKRILLTRILEDFECDTFFPVHLGEEGTAEGWRRVQGEELNRWVGEEVEEGVREEAGTRYVFEMWERVE